MNMASNGSANTAKQTAAQKAFATFDIVEEILLYLPVIQILISRKVSSTFAEVVFSSIHVRRALFLSPIDAESRLDTYCAGGWKQGVEGSKVIPVFNPFLKM